MDRIHRKPGGGHTIIERREFTLDRIDNNGDYEPGNVRWATRSEQSYNKRTTKEIKLALRNNPLDKAISLEYTNGQKGVVNMDMPAFNFSDMDIPSLREAAGLTHTEAKVLQMLMQEEIATHEQLVVINTRVRQLMYSLRSKLRKLGINIVNDRDIGYSIPLKYKIRIKNLIEGELVEELNRAHEISERLTHE